MAAEAGWFPSWFAAGWFPAVWFAPADQSAVPENELRPEFIGGGGDIPVPYRRRIVPLRGAGIATGAAAVRGRGSLLIVAAGKSASGGTAWGGGLLVVRGRGRVKSGAVAIGRGQASLDRAVLARSEDTDWLLLL